MKRKILITATAVMLLGGAFLSIVPIQTTSAANYQVHWYKKGNVDFYFKEMFTPSCRPTDYNNYTYMGQVVRSSPGLTCAL